jgi:hypothetical protein
MDLVFRYNGRLRCGDQFRQVQTPDAAHPLVFVGEDEREIFLVSVDDIGNFAVAPISPAVWASLQQRIAETRVTSPDHPVPRRQRRRNRKTVYTDELQHSS